MYMKLIILCHGEIIFNFVLGVFVCSFFFMLDNIVKHTKYTIISWPSAKHWLMNHIFQFDYDGNEMKYNYFLIIKRESWKHTALINGFTTHTCVWCLCNAYRFWLFHWSCSHCDLLLPSLMYYLVILDLFWEAASDNRYVGLNGSIDLWNHYIN